MILDAPAAVLSIRMDDVLDLLEETLKERNWKDFEMIDVKLAYYPLYLFNFDVLIEQKVQDQVFSQGVSGTIALNAATGELSEEIIDLLEKRPVDFERDIKSHEMKYEVKQAMFSKEEAKESCKLKLASKYGIGKDNVSISGFRQIYWPFWVVFISLPKKGTFKLLIDGVGGSPFGIAQVPEREKGWLEITQETFEKLKTPSGWAELSKQAISTGAGVLTSQITKKESKSLLEWFFKTKTGNYVLFLILLLVLILIFIK
ncbi:MAG: hypothetical protein QW097_00695 [archaeon]